MRWGGVPARECCQTGCGSTLNFTFLSASNRGPNCRVNLTISSRRCCRRGGVEFPRRSGVKRRTDSHRRWWKAWPAPRRRTRPYQGQGRERARQTDTRAAGRARAQQADEDGRGHDAQRTGEEPQRRHGDDFETWFVKIGNQGTTGSSRTSNRRRKIPGQSRC